ncbi:hypothetical protein SAMN05192533_10523 [Mesobacillus persicus]|uniref:Uncharacterized protein n=1 Tax=Mesobacillus persicus TaxID=930146 RepID=A0A1H8AIM7_9BACI|nr:hypothetical protein [Mesobacillus persicus]SEM70393.1 hypothetical protein SAMN05192533_10523 [Mesobacillus persicus]
MKAKIRLENTVANQELARKIREANRLAENTIDISFKDDLSEIFFEGERIVIPEKSWFEESMLVKGQAKEKDKGIEIFPQDKGKTVNLHLDAELVSELNEIKNHTMSKTQHDLILELFKKGLDQYNKEKK